MHHRIWGKARRSLLDFDSSIHIAVFLLSNLCVSYWKVDSLQVLYSCHHHYCHLDWCSLPTKQRRQHIVKKGQCQLSTVTGRYLPIYRIWWNSPRQCLWKFQHDTSLQYSIYMSLRWGIEVALHHHSPLGWVQGAAVWRLCLGGGASWVAGGVGYGSCLERRSRSRKRTSAFAWSTLLKPSVHCGFGATLCWRGQMNQCNVSRTRVITAKKKQVEIKKLCVKKEPKFMGISNFIIRRTNDGIKITTQPVVFFCHLWWKSLKFKVQI